jgi:hypothetical protein
MAKSVEKAQESEVATPAIGTRDAKRPAFILAAITDVNGGKWGQLTLTPKNFSTGSVGYYASEKLCNPDNPGARYQCAVTFTLIGSKPKA